MRRIDRVVFISEYGRSCNDIGCRSNEECVMAEDPCPLYRPTECGRYPTCSPKNSGGKLNHQLL